MTHNSHLMQHLIGISLSAQCNTVGISLSAQCKSERASHVESIWKTTLSRGNLLSGDVIAKNRLTTVAARHVVQMC